MHFWIVLACLWALTLGEGVAQIKGDGESLFYMYELPERVVDTWPASNLTLVRWSIYNSSFAENAGAGPLIDPSMGMYGTWQFSLFKLGKETAPALSIVPECHKLLYNSPVASSSFAFPHTPPPSPSSHSTSSLQSTEPLSSTYSGPRKGRSLLRALRWRYGCHRIRVGWS